MKQDQIEILNQIEILKWWHSGRNYQHGVMLLARHSKNKNKVLVNTLMLPGKEKSDYYVGKLHYELPKSVGLNWKQMPKLEDKYLKEVKEKTQQAPSPNPSKERKEKVGAQEEKRVPLVSDTPLDQYPVIIRKIKYQYSDLYKQRSVKHKAMREVAQDNQEGSVAKRATLLGQIKKISGEMDHLYRFIEEYEKNGTLPPEEIVWPPEPKMKSNELPDDTTELRKLKKNLQSANTKDRNRLLYQQRTQLERERPMPKGPKRTKIEHRIKKREEEIERIDVKIIELENAG